MWLGNNAWPSNQSCEQFAKDVFRIGAKTDKEKALAFFTWFSRCIMRGPNLMIPDGCGGYSRSYDTLTNMIELGIRRVRALLGLGSNGMPGGSRHEGSPRGRREPGPYLL